MERPQFGALPVDLCAFCFDISVHAKVISFLEISDVKKDTAPNDFRIKNLFNLKPATLRISSSSSHVLICSRKRLNYKEKCFKDKEWKPKAVPQVFLDGVQAALYLCLISTRWILIIFWIMSSRREPYSDCFKINRSARTVNYRQPHSRMWAAAAGRRQSRRSRELSTFQIGNPKALPEIK